MTQDEFYVGYLKLPAPMRRFLWIALPVLLIALFVITWLFVTNQQPTGDGSWDLNEITELEGDFQLEPYPLLLTNERTVLLVATGKQGVHESLSPYAQTRLRLRGHLIARNEQWMLELVDFDNITEVSQYTTQPKPALATPYRGRGQIIDPKCYLGVMKPGEGKVHKACATLCIKGGIPPMFLDAQGELYLLTDVSGGPIVEPILSYIADPIEVVGQTMRINDMQYLRIDANKIKRVQ